MKNSSETKASGAAAIPLVLGELEIPGHTGPLPTGEWGINFAAAQENFPRNGLQLYIQPWSLMGLGDSVQVLLDGDVVASDSIDADEVNQRVTLFIPTARLSNGAATISYRVTRLGSSPEPSAETRIYVKLDRPGGNDENGSGPGHSELNMDIPKEIVEGGVDKDTAKDGVPVTIEPYPNIAENDEIRLTWGGQFVGHTVTQAQAAAPESNPIIITVEEDVIQQAGDSGPEGLAVAFEVYDLVENRSEDWSAEIRIVVDTGSSREDAPIIKEAENSVLDLDALGEAAVTVQVVAKGANFAKGDQVEVKLTGTAMDQAPVNITLPPVTVTSVPRIMDISVANAGVRALAQTQAVFSYTIIKADNSAAITSKSSFISVIGEITRLAAPIASDAHQGALDPLLARTRIEIPWDAVMAEGQVINLKWLGTRPNFGIYDPELPEHVISHGEAEAKVSIFMTVDGRHLTPINGGTLELYYQLLTATRAVVTRDSLHSALLTIGEPRAEFPTPIVEYAQDGVLNPEDVPFGTQLIVPRYNGQAPGDDVHYEWLGSSTGKHTDSIRLTELTATRPVPFEIGLQLIQGNLGGTVLASYYVVRASGETSASEVLTLRIGEAGASNLPAPSVKDAPANVLDSLDALAGATVIVSYSGMLATDVIGLSWDGRNDVVGNQNGGATGAVSFLVPVAEVAKSVGKTLQVLYAVVRNDQSTLSEILDLTVSTFSESALPPVTMPQAPDDQVLNLTTFSGNAEVKVAAWPLIAIGQRVWLTLIGIGTDGIAFTVSIAQGSAIANPNGHSGVVPRTELEKFQNNSQLSAVFKITLDGSSDESHAINFSVLRLTVISQVIQVITENFENCPEQVIEIGKPLSLSHMTVKKMSGLGTCQIATDNTTCPTLRNGKFLNFGVGDNSSIDIEFNMGYYSVEFVIMPHRFSIYMVVYDEDEKILIGVSIPANTSGCEVRTEIAPSGKKVKRLLLSPISGDASEIHGAGVDNFVLTP